MPRTAKPTARPWPVTVGGLLILAQGLLLLLLSVGSLAIVVGLGLGANFIPIEMLFNNLSEFAKFEIGLLLGAAFGLALALLFVLNSLRFWQMKPRAWLTAMILQGLNLGLALALYLNGQRGLVFGMMGYGILMVIHLNRADVTLAFHVHPAAEVSHLDEH